MAARYYLSITLRTLRVYTLGLVQAYQINQQRLVFDNLGFPGQCGLSRFISHQYELWEMRSVSEVKEEKVTHALWCSITWSAFCSSTTDSVEICTLPCTAICLCLVMKFKVGSCPTSIYDGSSTGHLVWRNKGRSRYDKYNEESMFAVV